MTDYEPLDPTLQNILDHKSLRWIFVGGKGGVGKTTSSCSLAIQLAKVRESVLLISTDPAHNLSDAFGQKFGKDPRKIEGYDNLSAMEIDPDAGMQEMIEGSNNDMISNTMQDITLAIPGIDELVSFGEILKQVKSTSYSVIVFDTAPTGHTLRFLNMPTAIESAMEKLTSRFAPLLGSLMGGEQGDAFSKMNNLRKDIAEVNSQFKDADLTTFVCVCIAEFLSLYETERMVQELTSFHIDTHNIIVNQLLHPKQGSTCEQCNARHKIQQKYLEQILDLYEDFHIVQMPQLTSEVRGKAALDSFSEMLIHPAWKD